ncbi:MAG: hypothetical protein ACK4N5_01240, partial [Myxococcales bacterium]
MPTSPSQRSHAPVRLLPVLALLSAACTGEPPVIVRFDANPSTIDQGHGGFLKWETTGATSVTVSAGGNTIAESEQASGALEVSPESTTTYLLTARNRDGLSSATTVLTVRRDPKIRTFTLTPKRVKAGQDVVVAWATDHAQRVDIFDGEKNLPLDPAITTGSTTVRVERPMTLRLSARSDSREVWAEESLDFVPAPEFVSFTATPAAVAQGTAVVLAWQIRHVDTVKIVDGNGRTLPIGVRSGTDSFQTTPSVSGTYTLTATGFGGESSAATRVQVQPSIKSFSSDVTVQAPGGPVRLSWKTAAATSVRVARDGVVVGTLEGAQALDGTFADTIPATATSRVAYTLSALGDGEADATVEVQLGAPPVFVSLVADPPAVLANGAPTLRWETTNATSLTIRNGTRTLSGTPITSATRLQAGSYALPAQTMDTSYEVLLRSDDGVVVTRTLTIPVVQPPQILSFTASPNPLANGGGEVQLAWTAAHASEASIEDEGGAKLFETQVASVARAGSFKVRPGATSSYRLVVRGPSRDSDARTLQVAVSNPLPFAAAPAQLERRAALLAARLDAVRAIA